MLTLSKHISLFFCIFFLSPLVSNLRAVEPSVNDSHFDLRDYYGDGLSDFTTDVRSQIWGTCWTFGVSGAVESNFLMTGSWTRYGLSGMPDIAEYHLDKFNGFNRQGEDGDEIPVNSGYTGQNPPFPGSNHDEPLSERTHGMIVHLGGDYRIATAYLTNHGAVNETSDTSIDSGTYPEMRIEFGYSDTDGIPREGDYSYFIPRHVEWLSFKGTREQIREKIKSALLQDGAVSTCMFYDLQFFSYSKGSHYQPPEDSNEPNHAIVIVGWDDNFVTQAPQPGAWLCRNSWGSSWGGGWQGHGHFWISYQDKHAGMHPYMGAVTFKDMENATYDSIYAHALHGWQYDTLSASGEILETANCHTAVQDERLVAVGIYALAENVPYQLKIYSSLENPETVLYQQTDTLARAGFHMIDLDTAVDFHQGDSFCMGIYLQSGGYAFDASFKVVTAMGLADPDNFQEGFSPDDYENFYKYKSSRKSKAMGSITDPPYNIYSRADPGESFYKDNYHNWQDFYSFDAFNKCGTQWNDLSWNFSIIGYTQRIIYIEPEKRCGYNMPCYSSFEEAMTAAGAGDILKAAPGTYHSPLIINKPVLMEIGGDETLSGEGFDAVIISGSSS